MIHGRPKGSWWKKKLPDWTAGCIAVTNEEIREIWHLVADGTVIEIRP
jgi:murein L,D-transpeptidase YafK